MLCASFSQAEPSVGLNSPGLDALIAGREVIFVARELDGVRSHALQAERIDERHPPFSTFKIPNFLIALETGAIADPDAMRDWDAASRPASEFWPESWKQAHSLMTAFRHSAVWLFRDIALRVEGERYRQALARFNYGNKVAADGSDLFWLDGSLQISPLEQLNFLTRLLEGELEVAAEHLDLLREASLLDERENCRLHGKTGAGPAEENFDGPFEGWLVGWVECGEHPATVFALWTRGPCFNAIRTFRQEAAITLLTQIGAFDAPP